MKRNISYIFLSAVLMVCLIGCDLKMQPISEIGDGSFYKSTSELNAAVVACYNGLQKPMEYEWMLTALRTHGKKICRF